MFERGGIDTNSSNNAGSGGSHTFSIETHRDAPHSQESVSFLSSMPIEEFVAKYQVIKISWRGKYDRILAMAPTRFCTIDPRDFEVTNSWLLTAIISISLDPSDAQCFTVTLKGTKKEEQLKLRCLYRSRLLMDLYRLKEQYQQRNVRSETGIQCAKWSRRGYLINCTLFVGMDGITLLQQGRIRSKYLYTEIEHLSLLTDSQDGFAVGYTGRSRLLFSKLRTQIYQRIQTTAEAIGRNFDVRTNTTVESIKEERRSYGLNNGQSFVEFNVRKVTPKYSEAQARTLSLHNKGLLELDSEDQVVAYFNYLDLYVLVREPTNIDHFRIQLRNGQVRLYLSTDRDGVLSAIYDICVTCQENVELFISGAVSPRGLRLLPFSAVEDAAETQPILNEMSIGNWYLQRLGSLGKLANPSKIGDRSFVEIVTEFNANVPPSGIPYNTKQLFIGEALSPICAQLYHVAKTKSISERSAVTFLQALYRISSSYYGFREIGQAVMIAEATTNLLQKGNAFVVFWTILLLRRLTAHTPPSSVNLDSVSLKFCEQVETQNKKIFFTNTHLIESLISHLNDIDVDLESSSSSHRPKANPLVMMGLLQTLEGCICSRASTTGPKEFNSLVESVAKYHSTLLTILFQSRSATTVEACTLLLKTTLEECDPALALEIRDKSLAEGVVLRHFYQGLFDESFDQKCVSRYLVSLWMSHHDASKQLLLRVIPVGFLHLLKEADTSAGEMEDYDRLEQEALMADREDVMLKQTDDTHAFSCNLLNREVSKKMLLAEDPSGGAIFEKNFLRESASGILQNERDLFSRRGSVPGKLHPDNSLRNTGDQLPLTSRRRNSFETPIENNLSKARMLHKLKSSRTTTIPPSLYSFNRSSRVIESSTSNLLVPAPRRRKRDVARSFFGAIGGKKISFFGEKSINGNLCTMSRRSSTQENFRLLFHMLSLDHESVHLVWSKQTREELRVALYAEIKRFTRFQISSGSKKARWNFEDFIVPYPSLIDEVVVGECYISILAHLDSKLFFFGTIPEEDHFIVLTPEQLSVRNPAAVLAALHVRVLRENIYAEHRNDLKTSILCIKSMGVVAAAYARSMKISMIFEEVDHLWTLLVETTHASILEKLLHTIRALCLNPGNARRVLGNERSLELAVRLLQLAHSTDRNVKTLTKSKKLWALETSKGEQLGSYSVNELKVKWDLEQADMNFIWIKRQDDQAGEPLTTKAKLMDIAQLRWEVGLRGDINLLQVAHDAISILVSVAYSSSLLGGDSASPIFPPPRGKRTLWKYVRQMLPVLARSNYPKLWEKVATLLEFLYSDHQPICDTYQESFNYNGSSLFSWGLFYLAFLGKDAKFKAMAGILKATHKTQAGFHGCSALMHILPQNIINLLETCSSSAFTDVFCEGEISPVVIWSDSMRNHLQTLCQAHLQDYAEVLKEDVLRDWSFCPMAPVAYKELNDEIWCGGVYLGQYCKHDDFVIAEPSEFMERLISEWRVEVSRQSTSIDNAQALQILGLANRTSEEYPDVTLRAGFKEKARALVRSNVSANEYAESLEKLKEAYRVLTCLRPTLMSAGHDPENLLLLLRSLTITCKRYSIQLEVYAFNAYDLLLSLLNDYCTADRIVSKSITAQALSISVSAAELVYVTCAVSLTNVKLLIEQPCLNTLEKVINFCVVSMVSCEAMVNFKLLEVCLFLLRTISMLLASHSGREWIAESSTVLVDMVRILWLWNFRGSESLCLFRMTQQVLEGISIMTLLETNQQRLIKAGVVWQLLELFSRYDVELDDADVQTRLQQYSDSEEEEYATISLECQNALAITAVRALCSLEGLYLDDRKLVSFSNRLVRQVVDALMTPNLSSLLVLSSHHEFLKIYHGDCESYTLFWNEEMRQEQKKFLSPIARIEPSTMMKQHYNDAVKFRFMYLADLFYIGGLYIKMLMGSLLAIKESPDPAPINELGQLFFEELFSFIDRGDLVNPKFKNEEGIVQQLPPYAGWNADVELRTTTGRITALKCLSIAALVAPTIVGMNLIANDSAIKMVLRLLFPPDNEVHESIGTEQSLTFPHQFYIPCRLHCLSTLQVLSNLENFGLAVLDFGICDILIELVHICPGVGLDALGIIRNICANGAAAKCAFEILQSGVYLEFIGWMLLVEETFVDDKFESTDHKFESTEQLRLPSAMILYEMVKEKAPLKAESRRALCRFFPPAIIRTIASCPESIVEYLMADHVTPELVWNADFRNFQRDEILKFLQIYFSSISVADTEDKNYTSVVETFRIDYTDIYSAPVEGNIYLSLYMKEPTFNLHDPLYFMTCLWSKFEELYKELVYMTSARHERIDRADDELIQRDINLIDLVGSSLVSSSV